MIKSLTPYYVNTSFVSPLTGDICSKYTLELFVWSGLKADVPINPVYTVDVDNLTGSSGVDKVNISRLINDFIDFTPPSRSGTGALDSSNQLWLQYNVVYTTTDPLDLGVKQNIVKTLFSSGYGYGLGGENPSEPNNKVLLQGTDFDINKYGVFSIPILLEEDAPLSLVSVISYPNNDINKVIEFTATNDSSKLVQNIWIDAKEILSDEYIEVIYNDVTTTLYVVRESKFKPIDIVFQNKEGQMQFITFFKERKESSSITSEEFESDRGQPNTGKHQHVKYNVNAKGKFKANSGFVFETINEAFKQLLYSERVWMYNGNYIPLNVGKTSIEYKTRVNDRLINYEIDFDYAFNDINNI